MKKSLFILIAVLPFVCSCMSEIDDSRTDRNDSTDILTAKLTGNTIGEHMEGCLLVFLDETTAEIAEDGDLTELAEDIFQGKKIEGFEPALRHMPGNEAVARELGLHRWYAVSFDKSIPVRRFASEIAGHPGICKVQFNNRPKIASDCRSIPFKAQA